MEMTASPYRRHSEKCKHADDPQWKRCKCPMWIYSYADGKETRRSLKTRSWEKAAEIALEWIAAQRVVEVRHTLTIKEACEKFRVDAEARGLHKATLKKYRVLTDQLLAWADGAGLRAPSQLSLDGLQVFRASWADAPLSASKKLERLRAMCGFFAANGWIPENYAKAIKPPKVDEVPTLPFSQDEVVAMIAACDRLGVDEPLSQLRMKTLLLVLRYTGLRISDAVRLHESQIQDNCLMLRMEKTRVPVVVPLPDFLPPDLETIKRPNGFYFCLGTGATVTTDTGNWRRRLRRLAKLAKVENAHPHRFRDTFAVELLLKGVSIFDVSTLLGHASVKVTERSYSPWVQARRLRLVSIIRDTFEGESIPAATIETPVSAKKPQ